MRGNRRPGLSLIPLGSGDPHTPLPAARCRSARLCRGTAGSRRRPTPHTRRTPLGPGRHLPRPSPPPPSPRAAASLTGAPSGEDLLLQAHPVGLEDEREPVPEPGVPRRLLGLRVSDRE